IAQPSSQVLGSGFGHSGSTTKRGAWPLAPCASALCGRTAWPSPRAAMPATSIAPEMNLAVGWNMVASRSLAASRGQGFRGVPRLVGTIIGDRGGLVRAFGTPRGRVLATFQIRATCADLAGGPEFTSPQ